MLAWVTALWQRHHQSFGGPLAVVDSQMAAAFGVGGWIEAGHRSEALEFQESRGKRQAYEEQEWAAEDQTTFDPVLAAFHVELD